MLFSSSIRGSQGQERMAPLNPVPPPRCSRNRQVLTEIPVSFPQISGLSTRESQMARCTAALDRGRRQGERGTLGVFIVAWAWKPMKGTQKNNETSSRFCVRGERTKAPKVCGVCEGFALAQEGLPSSTPRPPKGRHPLLPGERPEERGSCRVGSSLISPSNEKGAFPLV